MVVLLLGAICSSAVMTFDGGGWKRELLGYVLWALMPYALLLFIYFTTRLFRMHSFVQRVLIWGIVVVALAGPLLYFDALFIHVDAQGALVVLTVPAIQAGGALFILIVALLGQWRINQPATQLAQQTTDMMRFNKLIRFIFVTSIIVLFFYIFIAVLQYQDRETIDTAKEVDFYIMQYCAAHNRLPTSARLHERFPDLSTNIDWLYFTDNETWLNVQYPMRWWNKHALGKPRISEFTATVYAYLIEYRCVNSK